MATQHPKRQHVPRLSVPMAAENQAAVRRLAAGRGLKKNVSAFIRQLLFEEAKRQGIEWPEEE